MDIKTTANPKGHEPRTMIVDMDFGTDIDTAVEKFGAEAVFKTFQAQAVVKAQGFMRSKLEAVSAETGDLMNSEDQIIDALSTWALPTGTRQKKSKIEKLRDMLTDLGLDEDAVNAAVEKAKEAGKV